MPFDREERYGRYERSGGPEEPRGGERGREEGAPPPSAVRHGYGMGYAGGALRSRGSYQAGQARSGMNPRDEFEFEWGEGYVGGRGYGGTNYDYEHGYRLGTSRVASGGGGGAPEASYREPRGPARYGYGPYHERLQRRRRSDEEIREDVEDTLFYDTWVDADRIEVSVEDGVVTLRGTLPSYDEVRYAVDDAWDVDGVRGVRSELRVGAASREPGARHAETAVEGGGREAAGRAGRRPQAAAEGRAGSGPQGERREGGGVRGARGGSPRSRASRSGGAPASG